MPRQPYGRMPTGIGSLSTDVILAFEPEVNNIVDSARKARRLLDEIASPHLKVVIDGANLFHVGELPRMREILDEAFQVRGDDIRLAHGKDLERDGDAGHQAAVMMEIR